MSSSSMILMILLWNYEFFFYVVEWFVNLSLRIWTSRIIDEAIVSLSWRLDTRIVSLYLVSDVNMQHKYSPDLNTRSWLTLCFHSDSSCFPTVKIINLDPQQRSSLPIIFLIFKWHQFLFEINLSSWSSPVLEG